MRTTCHQWPGSPAADISSWRQQLFGPLGNRRGLPPGLTFPPVPGEGCPQWRRMSGAGDGGTHPPGSSPLRLKAQARGGLHSYTLITLTSQERKGPGGARLVLVTAGCTKYKSMWGTVGWAPRPTRGRAGGQWEARPAPWVTHVCSSRTHHAPEIRALTPSFLPGKLGTGVVADAQGLAPIRHVPVKCQSRGTPRWEELTPTCPIHSPDLGPTQAPCRHKVGGGGEQRDSCLGLVASPWQPWRSINAECPVLWQHTCTPSSSVSPVLVLTSHGCLPLERQRWPGASLGLSCLIREVGVAAGLPGASVGE